MRALLLVVVSPLLVPRGSSIFEVFRVNFKLNGASGPGTGTRSQAHCQWLACTSPTWAPSLAQVPRSHRLGGDRDRDDDLLPAGTPERASARRDGPGDGVPVMVPLTTFLQRHFPQGCPARLPVMHALLDLATQLAGREEGYLPGATDPTTALIHLARPVDLNTIVGHLQRALGSEPEHLSNLVTIYVRAPASHPFKVPFCSQFKFKLLQDMQHIRMPVVTVAST